MRRRRILGVFASTLGMAVIAGGLLAVLTGGRRAASDRGKSETVSSTTSSIPTGAWRPVAPATTMPEQSPIQQQYDKGFEEGFSSPSQRGDVAPGRGLGTPRSGDRRRLAGSRRQRDARRLGHQSSSPGLLDGQLRPPEPRRARGMARRRGGARPHARHPGRVLRAGVVRLASRTGDHRPAVAASLAEASGSPTRRQAFAGRRATSKCSSSRSGNR